MSMMPLSVVVVEADAEIKPDTGSTSLGSIDEVVGIADAALDIPVAACSLPICEAEAPSIEMALSEM